MCFLKKNIYFCKSIVRNIYPKRNQSSFIIVYHLFLENCIHQITINTIKS